MEDDSFAAGAGFIIILCLAMAIFGAYEAGNLQGYREGMKACQDIGRR